MGNFFESISFEFSFFGHRPPALLDRSPASQSKCVLVRSRPSQSKPSGNMSRSIWTASARVSGRSEKTIREQEGVMTPADIDAPIDDRPRLRGAAE